MKLQITRGITKFEQVFAQASTKEQERLKNAEEYLGKSAFAKKVSEVKEWVLIDGLVYYIFKAKEGASFLHHFEPTFSSMSDSGLFRIISDQSFDQSMEQLKAEAKGEEFVSTENISFYTPRQMKRQFVNMNFSETTLYSDGGMDIPFPFSKSGESRKLMNKFGWLMTDDSHLYHKLKGVA
jgi:hypothetical protein